MREWRMKYIYLIIIWVAWCAFHSGLISLSLTERIRKGYPNLFRYHRIAYNLFAVATLVPVLIYYHSLGGNPIIVWNGGWKIIPISIGIVSLFLFVSGARRYDFLQFVGIRQFKKENTCSVLTDDCSLDTRGILSIIRHPWYAGGMLIVWARPLGLSDLLTNVVVCGYFIVGAMLEERKLKRQFGDEYTAYQRRVPMFFPIKRRPGNRV